MNECPNYYRLANGSEFWDYYATECTPHVQSVLCYDQAHALASACEYIFRAGRKTPNPIDDFRKAHSLIMRVESLIGEDDDREAAIELVSKIIGIVVQAKIVAEIAEKPKTVDLADPYQWAWTGVETHKP
jgi:hypothetical protein